MENPGLEGASKLFCRQTTAEKHSVARSPKSLGYQPKDKSIGLKHVKLILQRTAKTFKQQAVDNKQVAAPTSCRGTDNQRDGTEPPKGA